MKIFEKGLDALMAAIEDAASEAFDRELEEIGSSDVSIACMGALGSLGIRLEDLPGAERSIVRNYMQNCISKIRAKWN